MKFCIFDAWNFGDSALQNSHWVAHKTKQALETSIPACKVDILGGEGVTHTSVCQALAESFDGYMYFGHGRANLLYRSRDATGTPVAILESQDVGRIGARWFHAFACLSGQSLGNAAAQAGAAAYLGYNVLLIVEWDVPELPPELESILGKLATTASALLARGERSRTQIRRQIRDVSEELLGWLEDHAGAFSLPLGTHMGLHQLANILHQKLELHGTAVLP